MWLGKRQQLAKISVDGVQVLSVEIRISFVVTDLDVRVDSQLTLSDHTASKCRSCWLYLRQFKVVRQTLTMKVARVLCQALICSRLDYCNSSLFGISDGLLHSLQLLQNAAARLMSGAKKVDHVTPVLRDLH
jgi:hypothetical protein